MFKKICIFYYLFCILVYFVYHIFYKIYNVYITFIFASVTKNILYIKLIIYICLYLLFIISFNFDSVPKIFVWIIVCYYTVMSAGASARRR